MTKRYRDFGNKDNKKIKLDDDIEALWGNDELDGNVLEECIQLATQVCQQEKITCTQLNNVTILPTYSAFKGRSNLFSSTQLSQNNNIKPSTSKNVFVPKTPTVPHDLQKQMETLQQQCEEKEGEVSILRIQLQESKTTFQVEQQKVHNEWKQKLTQTERQMNSVKSELEFKNLEIANLKQKLLEITKHNFLDTTLNITQNNTKKAKQEIAINQVKNQHIILQTVIDPHYPLKGVIPETIFNTPEREQHIINAKLTHSYKNCIPYLQNQSVTSNITIDRSNINLNCIYPDILRLMNCTEEEFDNKENFVHINKVVHACEQFLYDLYSFLLKIKENLRTEDVLEADSNYLRHQFCTSDKNTEFSAKDEIGVKSSVILLFLAELLPYSEYLKKYVCRDKALNSLGRELDRKQFPYLVVKEQTVVSNYLLNAILNIVRISGEIRKMKFMSKFLSATIKLLINIHKSRNYDYVSDIFCKVTQEIILSRPPIEIIYQITFLFKAASQYSSFVEYLLNKAKTSISSKKGILYFNTDACRFYIFVMLFDNTLLGHKRESLPVNVCLNLLCFMYNTFKNSHWIHHKNIKMCECVSQLYKLVIEIVSKALENYLEETKRDKLIISKWIHFFKNPITSNILNLMTFNCYELTEKYITVFSQYKQIEKELHDDGEVIELEKLNFVGEVAEIPSSAFSTVRF